MLIEPIESSQNHSAGRPVLHLRKLHEGLNFLFQVLNETCKHVCRNTQLACGVTFLQYANSTLACVILARSEP